MPFLRKLIPLFFFFTVLSNSSQASHLFGGEIYWKCLANGKFVFYMDIYRECSGVSFSYSSGSTETLEVLSSIRPTDSLSQLLNSINLKADYQRWQSLNFGDISPICWDSLSQGLSCSNGDPSAIQVLPFKSDPIILNGIPPASGWTFHWDGFARPITSNSSEVALGLRATMYRIPRTDSAGFLSVNPCFDSSPRFAERPELQFCRGDLFSFTPFAQDTDADSLTYSWAFPVNQNGQSIPFKIPYTFNKPFPGISIDSSNVSPSLNHMTGLSTQAIFNGQGFIDRYTHVMQVDAWRCGSKIATIRRDIPIQIVDCAPLDSFNQQNVKPKTYFNGIESNHLEIHATAGDLIQFDFKATDLNRVYGQKQKVYLEAKGDLFASNFTDPQNCIFMGGSSCATLSPPPAYESKGNFGQFLFTDTLIQTQFSWQSSCNFTEGRATDQCFDPSQSNTKTINLLFKVFDDACPIRKSEYASVTIHLKSLPYLDEPIVKGASVGLDGKINLQWAPPIDSSNSFDSYRIEASTVNSGSPAGNYITVLNQVNNYKQEREFPFLNFPFNLWSPLPSNKDYYFRMKTFSGCQSDLESNNSQQARVIELNAVPAGAPNLNGKIQLNWNAAKPIGAQSKDYFAYESPTWYYIWQNDDANSDLTQTNNWYLREGFTRDRFQELKANVCSPLVALRVEARDTVITLKKGFGLLNPNYDTLVFSTFGIIDVVPMQIDEVEVVDITLDYLKADIDGSSFYQWIDCNSNLAIPNANSQQYIPLDTGKFKVIVGTGSCQDTSNCFYNNKSLDNGVTQLSNERLQSNAAARKYQWIDCRADTLIPGANSRAYSPTDTGFYAVIVSAYGYKDTSDCIPLLAIGLREQNLADQIRVFPNPSNGSFQIRSEGRSMLRIDIYSIDGKLVGSETFNQENQVDLDLNEKKGVYLLKVSLENKKYVIHKVIIK